MKLYYFQLQKLLKNLFLFIFLIFNFHATANNLAEIDSTYSQLIVKIADEIFKNHYSLITNDTLYVNINTHLVSQLPLVYKTFKIKYVDSDFKAWPSGRLPVVIIYPMYFQSDEIRFEFYLSIYANNDGNGIWICCEGCSSGGYLTFKFDCEKNFFKQEKFSFYNCF